MEAGNKEIISAEVFLDSLRPQIDTAEYDAELERIDRELQSYRCDANTEDYAIAVLCGILSGAVDALIIKQTDITKENITALPEQLLGCLQRAVANGKGAQGQSPVHHFKVNKGIAEAFPMLEEWSLRGTPVGFVSSLICQFSHSGMLRSDGEKLHILPGDISRSNGLWLAGIATVAATMKWLYNATQPDAEATGSLKTLDKLRQIMHANPIMNEVVQCVDKWQTQLSGEMKGYQKAMKKDMGIDDMFISLLAAISAMPAMKGTKLPDFIKNHQRAARDGITAIPLVKALSRQALPVVLNEILVRTAYFTVRLVRELAVHEDVNEINWDEIVPFGNRTIERMVTIASMTFTVADTTDAIIHAVLEACGDWVLFSGSFVKRFNIIGAGRATVAVCREISFESREAELLHEKRLLMEAKAEWVTEQLETYMRQLEERISEYLAEDISAFLTGFNDMDQGFRNGESDLVIKGNVVIQRVLGREPQFTNQHEFDDLMESDIPLKL